MLYIILALILSIVINIFQLKSNAGKNAKIKQYGNIIKRQTEINVQHVQAEQDKTVIRNEANEKENDIDNSNNILNGVMPIKPKQSHNHRYGSPCGKSCPAYIAN